MNRFILTHPPTSVCVSHTKEEKGQLKGPKDKSHQQPPRSAAETCKSSEMARPHSSSKAHYASDGIQITHEGSFHLSVSYRLRISSYMTTLDLFFEANCIVTQTHFACSQLSVVK